MVSLGICYPFRYCDALAHFVLFLRTIFEYYRTKTQTMKTTILPLAVVFVAVATMAAAQESKERLPENRFDMVKADGVSFVKMKSKNRLVNLVDVPLWSFGMCISQTLSVIMRLSTSPCNLQSSLTAIQEHHNRRMDKLKELIEERRRLVKAHESGERRLSGEDFDMVARQLRNFQRKLEHLDQTNDVVSFFLHDAVIIESIRSVWCCVESSSTSSLQSFRLISS